MKYNKGNDKKIKPVKKTIVLLVFLIVLLIAVNYNSLDRNLKNFLNTNQEVLVERIIDGDTIESNGTSIRLLGINTPERREFYYGEAKQFLEDRILNKTVTLRFGRERYDKYDRVLAYAFLDNKNINLELIENGFANYYFPSGKDAYYGNFVDAWNTCLNNNVNLCEKSEDVCSRCIELKNFSALKNICSFSCDINGWKIKAEGRNYTEFFTTLKSQEETPFILELTPEGDTVFLRDDEGKLVIWRAY